MSDPTLQDLLWLTRTEALAVLLGTVGMYLAMVVLVRVLGQRMLAAMSSYDLVAIIAFGAILGRAALGEVPVLGGGLVALVTLIALRSITSTLRLVPLGARAVSAHPVLLMADGRVLERQLRRARVSPEELQSSLRIAGIHHYDEVAAALLEPTGAISVLRRGEPIDAMLLSGVIGAAHVPPELLTNP